MRNTKKTLVVNLFAGPGAGKTTCAWEIASELKKCGFEAEYVSEYAKEFVWDNKFEMLDGSVENQKIIFTEQSRRVNRLIGRVDVIVTDSPTLLSALYTNSYSEKFEKQILKDFTNNKENFNIFIERGHTFQQTGRIHNLAQSCEIDRNIKRFLSNNNICYESYNHNTIRNAVNSILKKIETM